MICDKCTLKHDFLNYYSGYCIALDKRQSTDANTTLDTSINVTDLDSSITSPTSTVITSTDAIKQSSIGATESSERSNTPALEADIDQCIQNILKITRGNAEEEPTVAKKRTPDDDLNNLSDAPDSKRVKNDNENENIPSTSTKSTDLNLCRKPNITLQKLTGASYWSYEWRTNLCRCIECVRMYKNGNVEFLIDDEDTVNAYQEKGKAKQAAAESNDAIATASTSASTEPSAIDSVVEDMDHVQKVEAILAYNKLKEKLTEFFSGFVDSEKVITTKDVDAFFDNIKKGEQK